MRTEQRWMHSRVPVTIQLKKTKQTFGFRKEIPTLLLSEITIVVTSETVMEFFGIGDDAKAAAPYLTYSYSLVMKMFVLIEFI